VGHLRQLPGETWQDRWALFEGQVGRDALTWRLRIAGGSSRNTKNCNEVEGLNAAMGPLLALDVGVVRRCPVVPGPFRDPSESFAVGRVEGAFGCFAPAIREPPGHRPFAPVLRVATGEPALGRNPGDDLFHAGKASGGGAGPGDGGEVCGLKPRITAAADDQVVSDHGGMHAHELSDALPAQPEPVPERPHGSLNGMTPKRYWETGRKKPISYRIDAGLPTGAQPHA